MDETTQHYTGALYGTYACPYIHTAKRGGGGEKGHLQRERRRGGTEKRNNTRQHGTTADLCRSGVPFIFFFLNIPCTKGQGMLSVFISSSSFHRIGLAGIGLGHS